MKSSIDWLKEKGYTLPPYVNRTDLQVPLQGKVMDPDGWDRNNLSYSLQEVISEGEFKRRLSASSGHFNRMAEEDEANLQLGQDITNTMDITQQDGY